MKIDCEKTEPLLSAYLDGELTGAELDEVKAHLADCAHCREVLEQFRTVDGLYAELTVEQPTEGRWKRMLWNVLPRSDPGQRVNGHLTAGPRRIPMAIRARRSARWVGPVAAALALAGMVLVVVILAVGPGSGPGPEKLPELAEDNSCRIIELGSPPAGFEVMLHLPANAGDLLAVDIVRTGDDQSENI